MCVQLPVCTYGLRLSELFIDRRLHFGRGSVQGKCPDPFSPVGFVMVSGEFRGVTVWRGTSRLLLVSKRDARSSRGHWDLLYTALSVKFNALQPYVVPTIVRRFVCFFLFLKIDSYTV